MLYKPRPVVNIQGSLRLVIDLVASTPSTITLTIPTLSVVIEPALWFPDPVRYPQSQIFTLPTPFI